MNLLGCTGQIPGMVADAFKVADGMQQRIDQVTIRHIHAAAGQLHQICTNRILIPVGFRLQPFHLRRFLFIPLVHQTDRQIHALAAQVGHIRSCGKAPVHCRSRRRQKAGIQQLNLLRLCRRVGDGPDGQLLQPFGQGEHKCRGCQVKACVHQRNPHTIHRFLHHGEVENRIQGIK